jgi:hypothetical protein
MTSEELQRKVRLDALHYELTGKVRAGDHIYICCRVRGCVRTCLCKTLTILDLGNAKSRIIQARRLATGPCPLGALGFGKLHVVPEWRVDPP